MRWLLVLLCLLCPGVAAAWTPLPSPEDREMVRFESLLDSRTVTLEPGETLSFEPGRLRFVSVQFAPSDLEPYLRLSQVSRGASTEVSLQARPTRVRDGEWFLSTDPLASTMELRLSEEAPGAAEVAVARLEPVEPWTYWEWWQDELHAWMASGATAPVPLGEPIRTRAEVVKEASQAKLILDLVRQLGATEEQLVAARHLGHALLLRAVQRHRTPQWRFYRSRTLARLLDEKPSLARIETGTYSHDAWRASRDVPVGFEVVGPAVVELGVRAVKDAASPDAITRFGLQVMRDDQPLHEARFSSRAAIHQGAESEDDERRRDRDAASYVRVGTDVVGWRRGTQFWIPPGRHALRIVTDTDAFVDGRVHHPRTHVEDFLRKREDIEAHLEQARSVLANDDSLIASLLHVEMSGLLLDRAPLRELLRDDVDAALVRGWLAWRELEWTEPNPTRLSAIEQAVEDESLPPDLQREIAWALLRRSSEAGRNESADRLARRLEPSATETAARLEMQASARLRARAPRANRWRGFLQLWQAFRSRPEDPGLRTAVQRAWWQETYWDSLDAAGGQVLLLPLGGADEYLSVELLKRRESLLYALTAEPYSTYLGAAPDRPERLAKLRLTAVANDVPAVHDVTIDGDAYRLVQTTSLESFDFAVEAGAVHELAAGTPGVFATTPPDRALEVPADSVMSARQAHLLDTDEVGRWSLPLAGGIRFARVSLRLDPRALPEQIEIDDGVGEVRYLFPRASGEPSSKLEWVDIPFRVGAGVTEVSVRTRGGPVSAALQIRAPRPPLSPEPVDVAVRLPADDERLSRIREISALLATESRPELRFERLKLLMSLDQDRLARADAERLLSMPDLPADMLAQLEGLYEALLIRLSSRWLELHDTWLAGASSMPLDPAAALLAVDQCVDPIEECKPVDDYVAARAGGAADRVGLFRDLWKRGGPHDWLFGAEFARAVVRWAETAAQEVSPGLAAEAYGVMREVMQIFPSRWSRARYYGALRWTSWESVSTLSQGSFLTRFEPPRPPVNAERFDLPTMADETKEAVEHAMLGHDWEPDEVIPLYGFARRSLRYHVYWDGFLQVEHTCVDLRPDLQPDGEPPGCPVSATLEGEEGQRPGAEEGDASPGATRVWRWKVSAGEDVRLFLHRMDGTRGRRSVARVELLRSGRASNIPARRVLRRMDILPPQQGAQLDVQGPVVVRIDARGVIPGEAQAVRYRIDGGPAKRLVIPPVKEPEALLMEQPLTRSVRDIVWLPEARTYRLAFEGGTGFAAIRVALRTDDFDALLTPAGKGWLDRDEQPGEESTHDAIEPERFALELPRRSLVLVSPLRASLLAEVEYLNRDRTLLEDNDLVVRQRGYLSALVSGYSNIDQTWLWARLGSRLGPSTPVVEGHLGSYVRLPWRLRVDGEASAYVQRIASTNALAARLTGSVLRPVTLASDWLALPRLEVTGRLQPDTGLPGLAPIVFNSYASDHPLTFDEELTLWYRPLINLMAFSEFRFRHNTNLSTDQMSAAIGVRALVQSTAADIRYRARLLAEDRNRERIFVFHDFDLGADVAYWVHREHQLGLGLWSRLTLAPGTAQALRPRLGLTLTYWYSEEGLRDRPSSELIYGDLLEPRYFAD